MNGISHKEEEALVSKDRKTKKTHSSSDYVLFFLYSRKICSKKIIFKSFLPQEYFSRRKKIHLLWKLRQLNKMEVL